ncbi:MULTISPECIES: ROK family protein [Microbacterium]|uniref:ROK family protein n=1 Tax=Microbacterium schleiferi TaxID=69362 RepID=A0ABU7V3Z4_9MICO|nr:ROK family protein [Microbacterium sp. 67-17]OJV95413.1 MAG: sugar kinase [Microbacterium sp. 67-17]
MRLGLDVGGTKTDAVAVAPDGAIVARTRLATGWGPDAVVQTILAAVSGLCADPALATADIRSVGIGIPGRIEPGSGRVEHAVNLGVETLDLAAAVAPALGVPVRVENDVKAAALGAASLRGGTQSMGYLNLGTGMAAAVVTDGVLWRGARGGAGEIGHLSIDPAGPVCRCGQRGCIEALAGGGAVSARWGKPGALPIRDIFDAADAGDAAAVRLRTDLARGVAAAIRVLVLTADVDTVVLGGGITALGTRLEAQVAAQLETSAHESAFLRSLQLVDRVEILPVGAPAAALGAALIGAEAADEREVLSHG